MSSPGTVLGVTRLSYAARSVEKHQRAAGSEGHTRERRELQHALHDRSSSRVRLKNVDLTQLCSGFFARRGPAASALIPLPMQAA
jgi:hypothetical protein